MEQQNIKFDKFKFDATPYIIAANSFSKQFKGQENKNSDYAFNKLDMSISENVSECSKINEDLKEIQTDIWNKQQELDKLKREEEQQSQNSFDLTEAMKNMCKSTFVRDNEKCAAIARIIQDRLGFKLKLTQSQDDNPQQWIAKFSFDRNEVEGNYSVTMFYNTEDDSFTLCDMKPKPKRFSDMKIFLAKTNDVTGFLYLCWKSFMSLH